jgi:hypothetical protein
MELKMDEKKLQIKVEGSFMVGVLKTKKWM